MTMTTNPKAGDTPASSKRALDPIDRVSEILFGLIMVLTFTVTLGAAEAGQEDVQVMLIGALGCNLAWGIIDAVFYLMGCLADRGRGIIALRDDEVAQARGHVVARDSTEGVTLTGEAIDYDRRREFAPVRRSEQQRFEVIAADRHRKAVDVDDVDHAAAGGDGDQRVLLACIPMQ
jgi:hypothetical protein